MKFASMLLLTLFAPVAAQEIRVTGQLRSFNGTTEVPAGLFGVHATKLTPELIADWGIESERVITTTPSAPPRDPGKLKMVVECFYDRYQPALVLADAHWKDSLEKLARTYGAAGGTHHVEFWNEPFLNWATRPGVNYDARFYETTNRVEGAPMTIKGWDKPLDSLVWSKQLRLVDPKSGGVHYLANGDPPLQRAGIKEGEMYKFRGKDYRMDSLWWGKDPSQTSYYSAKQNSQFYRWMLTALAKPLKETNPKVQLIAGWGFNISSDGWRAWDNLFQPTIDDTIQWIDAIGEHHYGGNTRQVAADYEIAYAYALAKHGKRLHFYNTETAGQLDPQRPDTPAQSKWTGTTAEEIQGAFTYVVRDIVHLIDVCPDKAVARAQHDATANPGVALAFKFLKNLRGQLVHVDNNVPGVWAVASQNAGKLCVVVLNDTTQPVTVPLSIPPDAQRTWLTDTLQTGPYDGKPVTLAAKAAVKFVAPYNPPSVPMVAETQYVAGMVERATGPTTLTIKIPAEALQHAYTARLRVVYDTGQPAVRLNGQALVLPAMSPGVNEIAVPASAVKAVNEVVIDTGDVAVTGTASLILVGAK